MESVLGIIFSAENLRMLVLLAFGTCGFMWLRTSLSKEIDSKLDSRLSAFHTQLKANDFAHLNNTIEALTFTLEKNKFLNREDKEYIDGRLDK